MLPKEVHPLDMQAYLDQPNVDLDIDGEAQPPREWLESGGGIEQVVELTRDLHRLP